MLLDKTISMVICALKSHSSGANDWFAAGMLLFVGAIRLGCVCQDRALQASRTSSCFMRSSSGRNPEGPQV